MMMNATPVINLHQDNLQMLELINPQVRQDVTQPDSTGLL